VITVPGNLLLLGEYAVLEEGGLGLALAVDRRVRVETTAGPGLRLEGSWPGGTFAWTPDRPGSSPLAAAVVDCVETWLRENGAPTPGWDARIAVDSADLFDAGGRKRGFGASAAVAVGLVAALLSAAGAPPARARAAVPVLATRAHRMAQGGRGSGYDVHCSFHGAMGLFHGGQEPSWEPCRLRWDPAIFLFSGPASVSTPDAVGRYAEWKQRDARAAREFLEDSNRCVREFLRADSAAQAAARLDACRRLGVAIGRAIGVPASVAAPPGFDASACKALGAGNELGACLVSAERAPDTAPPGVERALIAERGIVWKE